MNDVIIALLKEEQNYYCDAIAAHAKMVKYPTVGMDKLAQKLFDGHHRVTLLLTKLL